ncbi:MAG: haloalkane dehalogenase [Acidimicrobiaceae bacterium]|jgi:haloalkane dehalogenase|nr:haloalkane dehalogenase [Acidimicrobiaceae bacterium]
MDVVRTPDDRFALVPGFPYVPHYVDVSDDEGGGLRVAYIDEGPVDARPVLLMHGEPSWSFLYRTMIPGLLQAGLRVVVPDLVGFGRSDKPTADGDYSYARHVEWMRSLLFDQLDLRGLNLFCQDWGGLIGLRLVAENPDRFDRVCVANTGLPDGSRRLPEAWWRFHDFVQSSPDLPIGMLVSGGVVNPMSPDVVAAYEAPFPDASFKAGARSFPGLIPQSADNPATPDNQRAWEVLDKFTKPVLCAFSDQDPITAGGDRVFHARVPGTAGQPHVTVHGGHFLQEDCGPELADVLVSWMGA